MVARLLAVLWWVLRRRWVMLTLLKVLEIVVALAPGGLAKIVRGKLGESGAMVDGVVLQEVAWAAPLVLPLAPGTFPDPYRTMEVEGWLEVERALVTKYLGVTGVDCDKAVALVAPVLKRLGEMLDAESATAAALATPVVRVGP